MTFTFITKIPNKNLSAGASDIYFYSLVLHSKGKCSGLEHEI